MTEKLYYDDLYAREFDAQIISQSGCDVILDRTLFYPSGGGQPCDLGTLNGVEVVDVHENGDGSEIVHVTKEPLNARTVHGVLDWDRRFELMQQHLGEHLFAGCLWNLHHIHTARMRIEGDNVSIDTDIPAEFSAILEAEAAANEAVWSDIPVEVIYPDMAEIRELARKLPPENAVPPVRIVKVEGVDYVPCCGLHVSSTGQAGLVKVTSFENHKGGSRIYLKSGKAAYRWLDSLYHEVRKAESELVCGYEGINEKIAILKTQIHDLKVENEKITLKFLRPLSEKLLKEAEKAGHYKIIEHVMKQSSQDDVKHLFKMITEDAEAVAVLASENDEGIFVMTGTNKANKKIDVRPAFKKAIEILNGKGGGSSFSAQGYAKNSGSLNEAVKAAVIELKEVLSNE